MSQLNFIDLEEAREVLAGMGIELSARQMKRAAETDAHGRRKLPFFIDPIDGKLRIEKGTLKKIYMELHINAQKNVRNLFNNLSDQPN